MAFKLILIFVIVLNPSLIRSQTKTESKQIKFVDQNANLYDVSNQKQIEGQGWAAWAFYDNSVNRTG